MYYIERRTTFSEPAGEPLCHTWNCFIGSTGALQVIIGIVSVILGIVVVTEQYGSDISNIGMPIWVGAWVRQYPHDIKKDEKSIISKNEFISQRTLSAIINETNIASSVTYY